MTENRQPFCPECLSHDARMEPDGYMRCDECGYGGYYWEALYDRITRVEEIANNARAMERERCAQVAEPDVNRGGDKGIWRRRRMDIAKRIRELE